MGRNIEISGGEGGIRTPGRGFSPYNGLANRPIKPLWHLSSNVSNTLAQFSSWLGALLVRYNSENVAATKGRGNKSCEINASFPCNWPRRSGKPPHAVSGLEMSGILQFRLLPVCP